MKKEVWIKADDGSWEEKKSRIINGLESGVDCVLIDEDDVGKARGIGDITIAAFIKNGVHDADILIVGKGGEGDGSLELSDPNSSRDLNRLLQLESSKGAYVEIANKAYERFAIELAKECDYIITVGVDWKVIPLENMIAELHDRDVRIIAGVKNAEEAEIALETLEHGADGVLLDSDSISEVRETVEIAERTGIKPIPLIAAKIKRVKPIGMGDRVCVDTCSLLTKGEGMLIGSQSNGFFLVHAESEESAYVAARPFRVNAGAVYAYILVGDRTRYLSELSSGDDVLVVDAQGGQRKAIVGRVKIEKRPLMLVEAEVNGQVIKAILQNAETIKLVSRDGDPVSITDLSENDEVLVYCEDSGRHFGIKVDESIIEK
jgi:3-dehydroquinate synthase II